MKARTAVLIATALATCGGGSLPEAVWASPPREGAQAAEPVATLGLARFFHNGRSTDLAFGPDGEKPFWP